MTIIEVKITIDEEVTPEQKEQLIEIARQSKMLALEVFNQQ